MKESKEIESSLINHCLAKGQKLPVESVSLWDAIEWHESETQHLTEINQTLRDQVKELKEENERIRNEHDAAVKRGREYAAERYEDGYKLGKIHGQEEQENRIKELEEGIAHTINNSSKLRSDRKNCDLLGDLLTKDTKTK